MTTRRTAALLAALVASVLVAGLLPATEGAAAPGERPAPSYRNAVSRGFADTFADPSVIRGKDGYWYAYGTSDPLREGEHTAHRVPIARSSNLVDWTHVGDAFTDATMPSWAAPDASLWAPDIRYVDGEYRMYYVVTRTTVTTDDDDNAIGMATAPTPTGPWTDSGAPVVGPRPNGPEGANNYFWTFDPAAVTDTDGSQWLFYGSYYGGIFVRRLSDDGSTAVGEPTMVAIDNKFEGAYVVRHDGWWYLFASTANCCAGPTTGYSVQVGRSRDLRGPYVDREGTRLTDSRAGGTPTLVQNGNRWVGPGHNALVTDLSGQQWIAYHAIDPADPYLDEPFGINERPMLLDRLDWIDGWPAVRGDRGPSEGSEPAPVTDGTGRTATTGSWTEDTDAQSGPYRRSNGAGTLTAASPGGDLRVEADLRSDASPYGLVAGDDKWATRVVVDPVAGTVRLTETKDGKPVGSAVGNLPANFVADSWHALSLERHADVVEASLTNARLGDPVASLTLPLQGSSGPGRAGALAQGAGVDVDNLSVLRAHQPLTGVARDVVPDRLDRAASDEFSGAALDAGWQWVRRDDAATVTGGSLRWPVQAGDLVGTGNNASVLLRDAPRGDWAVETRLTTDLGTTTVRNYQQGGLIAYVDDDLFTRLSHVAIWDTRQTEFGKEMPFAGRLAYGGTIVGPPADTTWLRLTHHTDETNGEHELRAWTSRDGRTWVRGGVWTLPADAHLRVGLISHGGNAADPRATSEFDYFRTYR